MTTISQQVVSRRSGSSRLVVRVVSSESNAMAPSPASPASAPARSANMVNPRSEDRQKDRLAEEARLPSARRKLKLSSLLLAEVSTKQPITLQCNPHATMPLPHPQTPTASRFRDHRLQLCRTPTGAAPSCLQPLLQPLPLDTHNKEQ